MLGVGPYITASIVMQLLGIIVPRINEIQKEEGQLGQQKINRWTRMLVVPLAALNGWGILQFLANGDLTGNNSIELPEVLTNPDVNLQTFGYWLAVITSMVAGSIVMMWIGELITEYKMGNGISLLILSGIIVRVPEQLVDYVKSVSPTFSELFAKFWQAPGKLFDIDVLKALFVDNPTWAPIRTTLLVLVVFISTLLLVVFINDAVRRLMIIYSRRGHVEGSSRTLGGVKADLPIKVNIAGVIPIIFAVSFILFPSIISRFFQTSSVEPLRNTALAVESYLSVNPKQNPITPTNLPERKFAGFHLTGSSEELEAIRSYDISEGQEILGFNISTLEGVNNSFFEGTFLNNIKIPFTDFTPFNFGSTNLGFLPKSSLYFDGFLAYNFFYFLLVVFFTYFYTNTIIFKTDEIAERMQKDGSYIPGYKPGMETQNYLSYVSNRLNVAGSIFLAIIALVPVVFSHNLNLGGDGSLNGIVGGTTLLILVSVTIETLKQIEAQATNIDYERFTKY
ncbi:MAG: preprotein translocase subunit SecY [Thermales bacterium]|nr:preprotein translocase subunit SecY [Thermales bacterium]